MPRGLSNTQQSPAPQGISSPLLMLPTHPPQGSSSPLPMLSKWGAGHHHQKDMSHLGSSRSTGALETIQASASLKERHGRHELIISSFSGKLQKPTPCHFYQHSQCSHQESPQWRAPPLPAHVHFPHFRYTNIFKAAFLEAGAKCGIGLKCLSDRFSSLCALHFLKIYFILCI